MKLTFILSTLPLLGLTNGYVVKAYDTTDFSGDPVTYELLQRRTFPDRAVEIGQVPERYRVRDVYVQLGGVTARSLFMKNSRKGPT